MKIIFVRHGEINLKTGTLTRTGVRQIKAAAKYLKGEKVDAIFCSPKTRTVQTANILKSYLGAEVLIEKNLNERQILTSSQRLNHGEEFDKNYLNYNFQSANYETCKDFIDRNFQGFLNIAQTVNPKVFKTLDNPLEEFKNGALYMKQRYDEQRKNGKESKTSLFPDATIVIAAHSSTLYAINAFINGIPKDGEINWLQCNNGAVVKFFL